MARRSRSKLTLPRLVAAASFAVVAGFFAVAVTGFLGGNLRASPEFRSMAKWPAYELLASLFAILLPLLQGVQRWLGRTKLSGQARYVAIAVLWVPLFLIAAAICGPVFGTGWFLIGFLVFTLVHFVSFECEEVRLRILGDEPRPLLRSLRRFAKCYGLAMVACGFSMFVVFLPMDVMGIFIESDPRLDFMSVAVGMFYFLLLGVAELIDLDGIMVRAYTRPIEKRKKDLEWLRRSILGQEPAVEDHPSPPSGVGRFFPPEALASGVLPVEQLRIKGFEEWVLELPVSDSARKRIQYWDRKLVRFGKPFRVVRRDRALFLAGAILCGIAVVVSLVVALHPESFKKKHARPSPFRTATHTEQSDRDAFKVMAGLAFAVGTVFGIGYWCSLKDQLDRPDSSIDGYHGMVTAKNGASARIRHSELVVEKCEPKNSTVPATRTPTEIWTLLARTTGRDRGIDIPLLDALSLRDAEILRLELRPYGFDADHKRHILPNTLPAGKFSRGES